jgi:hypothetical protein
LKTGARHSGITNSARVEKGNKKKILTGTSVPLDTCLLMGDPALGFPALKYISVDHTPWVNLSIRDSRRRRIWEVLS